MTGERGKGNNFPFFPFKPPDSSPHRIQALGMAVLAYGGRIGLGCKVTVKQKDMLTAEQNRQ